MFHAVSHCCLTSRRFHFHTAHLLYSFPRTVVPTAIHIFKDSLVDWLNKVLAQVVSPRSPTRLAVLRLHLCSYHQAEQVSVQRINSGEDVTATPVSSGVNGKTKHGKAGFTAVYEEERERQVHPHQ